MAKIERKYLAHYINAAQIGADAATYERLGKDLEEFSPELAAQVDTKKNILGETSVLISSYEKTGSVEPYYAEQGSALFERLQDIIDNSRVLDELKTDVVEVKLWESADGNVYPAIREDRLLQQLWPQLWGWRKGLRASPAWPARGGGSGAGIPAPTPAT